MTPPEHGTRQRHLMVMHSGAVDVARALWLIAGALALFLLVLQHAH
jgi:hypothetical protein